MKEFLLALIRYIFAGFFIAIAVVSLFAILYYYKTAMALIPAIIGGAAFICACVLTTKE